VDQIGISPGTFSAGGDSGSLIVTDDENNNPVGLLFAGSSTLTIANKIDLVLDHFGVTIDGETPPPPSPPAPPSNLSATAASSSQINLTWTDNSGNETGFKIESCSGDGCNIFAQIATVGANVTSYSNTGLSASTTYKYRVRAYNSAGDSAPSIEASAVTQAAPVLPTAPSDLIANPQSSNQINLTWTDNSDNETGFKIERCKGATCTNFKQIATVGANVTTYSNTGLSRSTTYRYRVRAYNAAGNSADYSNIASATTLRR
jgi:predicted phage tail protein